MPTREISQLGVPRELLPHLLPSIVANPLLCSGIFMTDNVETMPDLVSTATGDFTMRALGSAYQRIRPKSRFNKITLSGLSSPLATLWIMLISFAGFNRLSYLSRL